MRPCLNKDNPKLPLITVTRQIRMPFVLFENFLHKTMIIIYVISVLTPFGIDNMSLMRFIRRYNKNGTTNVIQKKIYIYIQTLIFLIIIIYIMKCEEAGYV